MFFFSINSKPATVTCFPVMVFINAAQGTAIARGEMLDGLERTDRPAELQPGLGVVDRHVQAHLSATRLLCGQRGDGSSQCDLQRCRLVAIADLDRRRL